MSQAHQPLVPLADRPFLQAEMADSEKQTIWHNPTDRPVVLDLYVETPKPTPGRPPKGFEAKTGQRRYVIGPKETKAIPAMFDRGIQQTQCHHVDCLQMPFDCKSTEEGHEKSIVGGLGPQLQNRGTQSMPLREGFIRLAEPLDDVEARRRQAEAEMKEKLWQEHLAREGQLEAKAKKEQAEADAVARDGGNPGAKPPKK